MIGHRLEPADFFVVRLTRQNIELASDLPKDSEALWTFLLQWSQQPDIRLALFVASPSLVERLESLKANDRKQQQKMTMSLLKYFLRSSFRSTPFGLFAGIHQGIVSTSTQLMASERYKDAKSSRLDMFYLTEIRDRLTRPEVLTAEHQVYANPTLWLRDNHFHYIDAYQSKEQRQFRLSAVRFQPYLAKILQWCKQPVTVMSLRLQFLQEYPDCAEETLIHYLQQLADERVILLYLPLVITDGNPDFPFAHALATFGAPADSAVITGALQQLHAFDQAVPGVAADLQQVSAILRQLDYPVHDAKLVQTDCWRAMQACTLDRQLGPRFTPVLLSLLQLMKPRKTALEDFAQAFSARYESAKVPLLAVLDDESGISFSTETGFDSPLLAGIPLRKSKSVTQTSVFNQIVRQLAQTPHATNLQFSSADLLAGVEKSTLLRQLPTSFAIKFALFGDMADPLIHYQGCSGPSAANLLGRFCHLNAGLEQHVKEHLAAEQALMPEALLAEVVHLPDGRPGNVIARPALRPFEIVLLADSGVDAEHQISLQDLSVYVENGRVCLWSERLQRRVEPRMSNAHNFSQRSLGLYRFLISLSYQSMRLPLFSWPDDVLYLTYLPQVSIDHCIVSCARWRLPRTELVALQQQLAADPQNWLDFSRKYQLPDMLCYAAGDNVLTINLSHISQLNLLLEETSGLEFVVLEEALLSQYPSGIHGPDGHYAHEILWPVLNPSTASTKTDAPVAGSWNPGSSARQFAPGSEWLSCKIYCGRSSAELLLQMLAPAFQQWQKLGWCSQWFFLRYGDPDWHLRLRFRGQPEVLLGQLYPALYQLCLPYIQSGRVNNLMIVSYIRETERYGGEYAIDLAERWFCQESAYLLRELPEVIARGEVARFKFALEMVDAQLTAFDYTLTEKLQWLSAIRQAFASEMQETALVRQKLGDKYRQYAGQLQAQSAVPESLLAEYLPQQKEIAVKYLQLEQAQQLVTPLSRVIGSLTHMLLNRIFKAYGREHEYLVYDMLRRRYLTLSQREKSTN